MSNQVTQGTFFLFLIHVFADLCLYFIVKSSHSLDG